MMIFLVSKKTGRFEHYCSTKPSLFFEVWQVSLGEKRRKATEKSFSFFDVQLISLSLAIINKFKLLFAYFL